MTKTVLLIACGALAEQLVQILRRNGWEHVRVQCLPPDLHNRPNRIPAAVREQIDRHGQHYKKIFVAYGDCGTGGKLDAVLQDYGVERLPGAHCYEIYAGSQDFAALAEAEAGTFYLTDFLARHFDRLVRNGLGLDERPELKDAYFGNYRRLVFLAQSGQAELEELARQHAEYLGLTFEFRYTGPGQVERQLREHIASPRS